MEKSIRHNVYAIVVISFCIGILYGLRAHAEGATVVIDDMKRQDCQAGKQSGAQQINFVDQQLSTDYAKIEQAARDSKDADDKGIERGHKTIAALLRQVQNDIKTSQTKLFSCQSDDKGAVKLNAQLTDRSNKIDSFIASLKVTGA